MKKILFLFLAILILTFTSACDRVKPSILFNNAPITAENATRLTNVFSPGMRIYYLVIIPKPIKSRYAYIQIIKKEGANERLGYKMYYGNTVRLKDEQMYYYDDYIVIYEKGTYVMKIYSKDNPTKVLTMAQFWVQ